RQPRRLPFHPRGPGAGAGSLPGPGPSLRHLPGPRRRSPFHPQLGRSLSMNQNVLPLIERFGELRIAVVGDAMLDVMVLGTTERLCREAPVPVVKQSTIIDAPGGAANTAANLAAMGAHVSLVGATGDDDEGWRLLDGLISRGIDVTGVLRCRGDYGTLVKTRVMA